MLAEWLRRLTRNQLGFARVGSNPAHDDRQTFFLLMCSVGSVSSVFRGEEKKRGAFLAVLLLYKKKERRRANEIF